MIVHTHCRQTEETGILVGSCHTILSSNLQMYFLPTQHTMTVDAGTL